MLATFANAETEKIFNGIVSRKLPTDIQKTARRKLLYLDEAEECSLHLVTGLRDFVGIGWANTVSE